jgi:hypothetical protein
VLSRGAAAFTVNAAALNVTAIAVDKLAYPSIIKPIIKFYKNYAVFYL